MKPTYNLKLYSKNNQGEGVELSSLEQRNNSEIVTQWLLTPRAKGQSKYFLALVDQQDTCIDAKYITRQTMLVCLERWSEYL